MRVKLQEAPHVTRKPPRASQIVAAVIGNALEWYDFVVYGFLTVIIARLFFPTQDEYAALLLILLARLLQGFATGGEFASATSFLVESAPPNRRGFYGSLQMVGQSVAALTGAIAGTLITRGLAPEQIDSWGWRLPFLFGLVIGPVGLYIRRYLEETQAFIESRASAVVGFAATIFLTERHRDANLPTT